MKKFTATRLADLCAGDRLVSLDGRAYTPARIVAQGLGIAAQEPYRACVW